MPSFDTLALFVAASFVIAIAPGPSNLYVLSRAVAHGRRAGLLSAGGMALGGLVHAFAAALGLSAIFAYSPTAFTILKYVGAAYLVYLGIRGIVSPRPSSTELSQPIGAQQPRRRRLVRQAALTEILNPKVAIFFIAFLPQFVAPSAATPAVQLLALGILYTLIALPCDATVAIGGHYAARFVAGNRHIQRLLDWLCGMVLIALGLRLAMAGRP